MPQTARQCYFNSRPSARGDVIRSGSATVTAAFQFTPLREGRPKSSASRPTRVTYFNSRPSARGDLFAGDWQQWRGFPIPAPPRGATLAGSACDVSRHHFNSRPSARGDHRRRSRDGAPVLFQFTPLREGRPLPQMPMGSSIPISIHAPPRGATGGCTRNHLFQGISIHAPPRGATISRL